MHCLFVCFLEREATCFFHLCFHHFHSFSAVRDMEVEIMEDDLAVEKLRISGF